MDSAPSVHPTVKICQILSRYLVESGRRLDPPISVLRNAPAHIAEVTVQTNSWDCGVFLLKYASHCLDQHVRGFPIHITRNTLRYYPNPNDISALRREIVALIWTLAKVTHRVCLALSYLVSLCLVPSHLLNHITIGSDDGYCQRRRRLPITPILAITRNPEPSNYSNLAITSNRNKKEGGVTNPDPNIPFDTGALVGGSKNFPIDVNPSPKTGSPNCLHLRLKKYPSPSTYASVTSLTSVCSCVMLFPVVLLCRHVQRGPLENYCLLFFFYYTE
jgi:hypothetical protein